MPTYRVHHNTRAFDGWMSLENGKEIVLVLYRGNHREQWLHFIAELRANFAQDHFRASVQPLINGVADLRWNTEQPIRAHA